MCLETIPSFYKKQKVSGTNMKTLILRPIYTLNDPTLNAFYIENKSVNVHHILIPVEDKSVQNKISKNLEK